MRVCIDATSLLLRSAGIKNYTYFWLQALQQRGDFRAFPALGQLGPLDHERSVLAAWQTYPRIALLHAVNWLGSPVLDAYLTGIDLFHASNQVRRKPTRARLTATVHDLTTYLMPELHTAGNVRADREFTERMLSQADGLIAVSENTRQDVIRLLNIAPDRVQTIHSGVAPAFFDAQPLPLGRSGLDRPYVLSLGTIEPRKNLDTLLDAYTALPPDVQAQYPLVIAGATGWRSERTVARLRSGLPHVHYLGYLPEHDLPGLTAGAALFVYPSLYEGFGFPVAQAMAAGVAVVTSNNSCLPEIAGPGGEFVDPRSADELRRALLRLLTSPDRRAALAAAGRQYAERYQWSRCAEESVSFFTKIVGR